MTKVAYDFDRYFRLLEGYQSIREALFESDKIAHHIRETYINERRLELERKKSFLNEIIEAGKFFAKLGSAGVLTSLTLSNFIPAKELILSLCVAGFAIGVAAIVMGLDHRSKIEERYIDEIASYDTQYDDRFEPLVRHTEAINNEVAILNEMVRLEQQAVADEYPEMSDVLKGLRKEK